jgi:hypothetical protein
VEECLCWRANDWRKRLLINPFHLSQFPTQSKAFYLKGGCSDHSLICVHAKSGQKEDARRNRSFFLRRPLALSVCVCVCGFFCCCLLSRPSGHYIKEPDRRKKRPSLWLSQCIFVACRFPRRSARLILPCIM